MAMLTPDMTHVDEDNRTKQIAIGAGILLVLTVLVCAALIGWRYLPGLLGEWLGMMIGVMTTPFFLEASFVILGFTLVMAINIWRRHREGDELVYLEQIEGADVPKDMPDQAKWAVYRHAPLEGETPSLLVQAEGAVAIGDFETAADCISSMTDEELHKPETLALRLELAKNTGKLELVRQLEDEIQSFRHEKR